MASLMLLVEGESDKELARRLALHCGHTVRHVRVARGSGNLDTSLGKCRDAARNGVNYFVLRDTDGRCPVELLVELAPGAQSEPGFCLRLAHRESETWLLASRQAAAAYFGFSAARIPAELEQVADPKRLLLQLCRDSRKRLIREEVVGQLSSGALVCGPLYVSYLNDFYAEHWDIAEAMGESDSLRRAVRALQHAVG